jgi:PAS domain S-box-containing protein
MQLSRGGRFGGPFRIERHAGALHLVRESGRGVYCYEVVATRDVRMTDLQPAELSSPIEPAPAASDQSARARRAGLALADIVRELPLGVVTATPDGTIAYANESFAALLGYPSAAELEGLSVFDLTHPDDRALDEVLAAEVRYRRRTGYTIEKRFTRTDGGSAWAAVSATLNSDQSGEADFALGIVQDIGERKAAEAEAAEALARAEEDRRVLQAVMSHVPEGITIADAPDVRIRMVSSYGASLTGRAHGELEAITADSHPEAWDLFWADGVTRARPEDLPLTRATVSGEIVKDEEWVIRRPDGTHTTILCNAGPIRDADGRITGGIIAWRDIDERKKAALERERLLLAERDARGAAEAATRARGEFLASMSHELRTPLNAILGYQDLLEAGVGGKLTEVQQQYVDRVRGSARHLLSLINQILSFSRIDAGAVEYEVTEVPVSALLQTAEPLVAPQALSRRVLLSWRASEDAPIALADPEKATQVLLNLLANAVKFTPPGGRVDVAVEHRDSHTIAIHVSDTGVGISESELDGIFEPFRQGMNASTGRPEGTGLGLSISRALARGMGGDIVVESAPGKGSTFTLLLRSAPR